MSWILATTYGSYYTSFLPYSLFYIYTSLTQNVQQLISYSYIAASVVPSVSYPVVYGYYGGYYWYGYTYGGSYYWYGSLAQSLSDIYPYITYLLILGYIPYSVSYIFAYASTASPYVYPPPSYSYINVEVPVFSISIIDQSFLSGPPYTYVSVYDLSYLSPPLPTASIYDLSYLAPPSPMVSIYDISYLTLPPMAVGIYDISYLTLPPMAVGIYDISYLGYKG